MLVGVIIATARTSILRKQDRVTVNSNFIVYFCHVLENIHYLAVVMCSNGCTDSIMHNQSVFGLSHQSERLDGSDLGLSAERNHPMTPLLPGRKRKIHEHPEGLGEVHLFPGITK